MRFEPGTAGSASFQRSVELTLRAAQHDFEATGVCLYALADPETLILRNSWWEDVAHNTSARLSFANLELSPAATAWLFGLREPQLLTSANQHPMVSDYPETLLHQFRDLIIAPVLHDGKLQGILTVGWREEQSHAADWKARVECLLNGLLSAKQVRAVLHPVLNQEDKTNRHILAIC